MRSIILMQQSSLNHPHQHTRSIINQAPILINQSFVLTTSFMTFFFFFFWLQSLGKTLDACYDCLFFVIVSQVSWLLILHGWNCGSLSGWLLVIKKICLYVDDPALLVFRKDLFKLVILQSRVANGSGYLDCPEVWRLILIKIWARIVFWVLAFDLNEKPNKCS